MILDSIHAVKVDRYWREHSCGTHCWTGTVYRPYEHTDSGPQGELE